MPDAPPLTPVRRSPPRAAAWLVVAIVTSLAARDAPAAEPQVVRVFETARAVVPKSRLDELVGAEQRRHGVAPARSCSADVFVRRVYLDVAGRPPEPQEVLAFQADDRADRRARLVESLLRSDDFAEYWSLRWCDALRVKSEFPINLWPNAVQAYHRWVHDAVRDNIPYDLFARDLLTSSGSNFREPPVNFYRALQGREPRDLAAAVALTFMGARIDAWPPDRQDGAAALFSRVAYKRTSEWKEEIVLLDPAPAAPLDAVLPDGTPVRVPAGDDPRRVFADWLVTPENPWFARAAVNRVWAWIFGRGLVHEADDLRDDNPPVIPEALDYLAEELVASGWDMRHVCRIVLNSRTYQQSPVPRGKLAAAERLFACYPVRRLDAEILIDALDRIGGSGEEYYSQIPEPYTFIPSEERTVALADGSITSPFLQLFGRPARDTGLLSERSNEPTDDQRLFLLNSSGVRRRIQGSPRLRAIFTANRRNLPALVRRTYLLILSRFPGDAEAEAARAYFVAGGRRPQEAAADLAWALINSKEFLYRH